tara:strand:+ start:2019 stop:2942 length:924 start_codon:yes stop_codon:yes gene_type:complete
MVGEPEDIAVEDIDYFDPDEEQETVNLEGEQEAHPGDDEEPAEMAEAEENDEENPDEAEEPTVEDPEIDLGDGLVLPASELRSGYMRDKDYRQKTTELSQERQTVQQSKDFYAQQAQSANSLLQETVGFLQGLVPPEPPLSLAQTNPQDFQYQKELRERTIAEINGIVQKSQQAQQSQQKTQTFDQNQAFAQHVAGLERRFPHLKGDNNKIVSFIQQTRKAAVEQFGLTPQEASTVTDDRFLEMAHYASLGKKAEHNRNNAQRRIQPAKKGQGRAATGNKGNAGNRKAMQRLSQTGSIKDALMIDFD